MNTWRVVELLVAADKGGTAIDEFPATPSRDRTGSAASPQAGRTSQQVLPDRAHAPMTTTGKLRATLAIAAILAECFTGVVAAQDAVSRGFGPPRVSGSLDFATADKYVYQGYILENRGPVFQPNLELLAEFYTGDGFVTSASARLNVFNSFQFHNRGRSNMAEPMRTWYEFEVMSGIQLVLAKDFTFTASYRRFESPNGFYGSANGFHLTLAYDDAKMWGGFALNPRVLWIVPLDRASTEGHYFEGAIEPGITFWEKSRYPLAISVPVTLGVGDNHSYAGERFGFASAGVTATVPLAFLPEPYGKWSLFGSATYYRLGSTTAAISNDGERNQMIFSGALGLEF
jgi:hypothetical protein